jgi:hypothetical protein
VRVLLAEPLPEGAAEDTQRCFYAGRAPDGIRWTLKPAEAWDFGTVPTAQSILERDRYLRGWVVVEMR